MPDISKSTTRTTRGEGSDQVTTQTTVDKQTTTQEPTKSTSKTTQGAGVTTTTEKPGVQTTESTENSGLRVQKTIKPETITTQTAEPVETVSIAAPSESTKIEREDYGIQVTIKLKLSSISSR